RAERLAFPITYDCGGMISVPLQRCRRADRSPAAHEAMIGLAARSFGGSQRAVLLLEVGSAAATQVGVALGRDVARGRGDGGGVSQRLAARRVSLERPGSALPPPR